MKKLLLTLLVTLSGMQAINASQQNPAQGGGSQTITKLTMDQLADLIYNTYQSAELLKSLNSNKGKEGAFLQLIANDLHDTRKATSDSTIKNLTAQDKKDLLQKLSAKLAPAQTTALQIAGNVAFYAPISAVALMAATGAARKAIDICGGNRWYDSSFFSKLDNGKLAGLAGLYGAYYAAKAIPGISGKFSDIATGAWTAGKNSWEFTKKLWTDAETKASSIWKDKEKAAKDLASAVSKPTAGMVITAATAAAFLGINHRLYGNDSFFSAIRNLDIKGLLKAPFKQTATTCTALKNGAESAIQFCFLSAPTVAEVTKAAPAQEVMPTILEKALALLPSLPATPSDASNVMPA